MKKRTAGDSRKKDKKKEGAAVITDRQQSFYEVREPSDADLQWMKVIYRQIDLTKGKNPTLSTIPRSPMPMVRTCFHPS